MADLLSLSGVALITGAARGIGKEAADTFAEAGCRGVVYADVDLEEAESAAKESEAWATNGDYRAVSVFVDVSDAESVQNMVDRAIQEFGRIDYSVNAAGIANSTLRPTAQASLQELNRIIDINLKGTAFCIRAVIDAMKKQDPIVFVSNSPRTKDDPPRNLGRGAIVNLGSANSYMTQFGTFAYTASKHGVVGLTKAAAFDHAKNGIRVNAVCPGPVDTRLMAGAISRAPGMAEALERGVPLGGRMAHVREIASVVVFLCGPGASYMTGAGVLVDAGVSLSTARL
ncbi:oxidoreductase [Clohesyomyces aquaticus]|uniref:Oxidoreductase n=1 Tax=Clohesyomyces aquaticus TaxID=1231657 RepID=A0A1Y1YAK0_9PLEO|nr:oxidoreductase [Clohesyomyces aquaticus]